MSPLVPPHPTTEGRRGSRIDLEGRGHYLSGHGTNTPPELRHALHASESGHPRRLPRL